MSNETNKQLGEAIEKLFEAANKDPIQLKVMHAMRELIDFIDGKTTIEKFRYAELLRLLAVKLRKGGYAANSSDFYASAENLLESIHEHDETYYLKLNDVVQGWLLAALTTGSSVGFVNWRVGCLISYGEQLRSQAALTAYLDGAEFLLSRLYHCDYVAAGEKYYNALRKVIASIQLHTPTSLDLTARILSIYGAEYCTLGDDALLQREAITTLDKIPRSELTDEIKNDYTVAYSSLGANVTLSNVERITANKSLIEWTLDISQRDDIDLFDLIKSFDQLNALISNQIDNDGSSILELLNKALAQPDINQYFYAHKKPLIDTLFTKFNNADLSEELVALKSRVTVLENTLSKKRKADELVSPGRCSVFAQAKKPNTSTEVQPGMEATPSASPGQR